jgi:hypothetical protein
MAAVVKPPAKEAQSFANTLAHAALLLFVCHLLATFRMNCGLPKYGHDEGTLDMGGEGREPANMPPDWADELAKYGAAEKPLSLDDMTGGVPTDRFRRHLALSAWQYIEQYGSAKEPLPDWVVGYLKSVAISISANLSPKGALSREGASSALGIDGKAWPEHSPIVVYLAMQEWIDGEAWPDVTGPKAAASHYIKERMAGDRDALPSTLIRLYKEGKRLWLADE